MDSYLIMRGQIDAPRPNDVWCNMYIDKCIELGEAAKTDAVDLFGEEEAANLVDRYDEKIQELEDKRAAQDRDNNDESESDSSDDDTNEGSDDESTASG